MHSKSKKSAPKFENRRGHLMKRVRKWWLITHFKTFKSKHRCHLVRAVEKLHKSNNDSHPSLTNLCKSVHDFTKLNPQESSTNKDLKNPEKSSSKELQRATTRGQKISINHGLLLQICKNLLTNSENRPYH